MLEIKGLEAQVEGNSILRGLDLTVKAGEVHAIMPHMRSFNWQCRSAVATSWWWTSTTMPMSSIARHIAPRMSCWESTGGTGK